MDFRIDPKDRASGKALTVSTGRAVTSTYAAAPASPKPAPRSVTRRQQNSAQPTSRLDLPLGTAAWAKLPPMEKVLHAGHFYCGVQPDHLGVIGVKDDRHVLICGGTRGGKGISAIVPNLIAWHGSAVVVDPKGENAIVTARRRGNGSKYAEGKRQKVRILDPFGEVQTTEDAFADLKCRFNPLDQLRTSDNPVDDASLLADAIVVAEKGAEQFWDESSKQLLSDVMLHVVSDPHIADQDRNLITVRNFIVAGHEELRELALRAQDDNHDIPSGLEFLFLSMSKNKAFGGVVARAGCAYADMYAETPKTVESIFSVARVNTHFIDSPAMQRVLVASDFKLSELKSSSSCSTVYLCLPHRYMGVHYRWLRLMTTLVISEMERIKQKPRWGIPILMMLDEFTSLKRMKILEDSAAQIAGHGVKLAFVVQSLGALKEVYKDNWETFVANCNAKLFFANDDQFTREYVSKLVGDCEVGRSTANSGSNWGQSETTSSGLSNTYGVSHTVTHSSNTSFGGGNVWGSGISYSSGTTHSTTHSASSTTTSGRSTTKSVGGSQGIAEVVHKRPLVTPDEVGRLFGDVRTPRTLLLLSGHQPIIAKRVPYFQAGVKGFYDPHPNFPPPPTRAELERRKRQLAWEKEEAQRRERERMQAEWARDDAQRRAQSERERRRREELAAAQAEKARLAEEARLKRLAGERLRFRIVACIVGLFFAAWIADGAIRMGLMRVFAPTGTPGISATFVLPGTEGPNPVHIPFPRPRPTFRP